MQIVLQPEMKDRTEKTANKEEYVSSYLPSGVHLSRSQSKL